MSIADTLANYTFFQSFDAEAIAQLASVAQVTRYEEDQLVRREGEPSGGLLMVLSGAVRVEKRHREGKGERVAYLGQGELLGELSFIDGLPLSASLFAAEEGAEVLALDGERVREVIQASDKRMAAFYRALAEGMCHRMRETTDDAAFYKRVAKGFWRRNLGPPAAD